MQQFLKSFLSLLYGGSDIFSDNTETDQTINQDLSYEKETSLMKRVMLVCRDIVYGVSKGKYRPKHYVVGFAAHQISNRNKN